MLPVPDYKTNKTHWSRILWCPCPKCCKMLHCVREFWDTFPLILRHTFFIHFFTHVFTQFFGHFPGHFWGHFLDIFWEHFRSLLRAFLTGKCDIVCPEKWLILGPKIDRFGSPKVPPAKMRFVSAQLDAYISNDVWLKNAKHANKMGKKFIQLFCYNLSHFDYGEFY